MQVLREPINHFGTPALSLLAVKNRLANIPVKQNQCRIG